MVDTLRRVFDIIQLEREYENKNIFIYEYECVMRENMDSMLSAVFFAVEDEFN